MMSWAKQFTMAANYAGRKESIAPADIELTLTVQGELEKYLNKSPQHPYAIPTLVQVNESTPTKSYEHRKKLFTIGQNIRCGTALGNAIVNQLHELFKTQTFSIPEDIFQQFLLPASVRWHIVSPTVTTIQEIAEAEVIRYIRNGVYCAKHLSNEESILTPASLKLGLMLRKTGVLSPFQDQKNIIRRSDSIKHKEPISSVDTGKPLFIEN